MKIDITKVELGDILAALDKRQADLWDERRKAKKIDRVAIDERRRVVSKRIFELEAIFDTMNYPDPD